MMIDYVYQKVADDFVKNISNDILNKRKEFTAPSVKTIENSKQLNYQ